MDSVQRRILALMTNALMHLVKEVFGDDELEKFFDILCKRDSTAWRTSLLRLVLIELIPILGGNVLFYLCKMLIPLSFFTCGPACCTLYFGACNQVLR
ncbi:hypothetical protein SLA2020_362230 [Shorea laevis]